VRTQGCRWRRREVRLQETNFYRLELKMGEAVWTGAAWYVTVADLLLQKHGFKLNVIGGTEYTPGRALLR